MPQFYYQWKRNGVNIPGATSSTYTQTWDDEGAVITCQVTASNPNGLTVANAANVTATENWHKAWVDEISPHGSPTPGSSTKPYGSYAAALSGLKVNNALPFLSGDPLRVISKTGRTGLVVIDQPREFQIDCEAPTLSGITYQSLASGVLKFIAPPSNLIAHSGCTTGLYNLDFNNKNLGFNLNRYTGSGIHPDYYPLMISNISGITTINLNNPYTGANGATGDNGTESGENGAPGFGCGGSGGNGSNGETGDSGTDGSKGPSGPSITFSKVIATNVFVKGGVGGTGGAGGIGATPGNGGDGQAGCDNPSGDGGMGGDGGNPGGSYGGNGGNGGNGGDGGVVTIINNSSITNLYISGAAPGDGGAGGTGQEGEPGLGGAGGIGDNPGINDGPPGNDGVAVGDAAYNGTPGNSGEEGAPATVILNSSTVSNYL